MYFMRSIAAGVLLCAPLLPVLVVLTLIPVELNWMVGPGEGAAELEFWLLVAGPITHKPLLTLPVCVVVPITVWP